MNSQECHLACVTPHQHNIPKNNEHAIVQCYKHIDDITIFSKTKKDHLIHLETVFNKSQTHSLTLQLDKTEFFHKELPFLGYILTLGRLINILNIKILNNNNKKLY